MSMSWFRMYNSFLHEPNVQRLPPPAFKIYVNCLCIASANDPRGSLPSLEDLAFLLKVSEKKAEKFFNFLKNSELFEEKNGFIFIREWDKKQFESDNVTVRTQRHRERRERSGNVAGNVAGNVSGTPPDTDTDTDTDLTTTSLSLSEFSEENSFRDIEVPTSSAEGDLLGDPKPAKAPKFTAKFCKQVIDAYHEILPELPRAQILTTERQRLMRKHFEHTLTADNKTGLGPNIENWRGYFSAVRDDDWAMGRIDLKNGSPPFKAKLEYIISERGFSRIHEAHQERIARKPVARHDWRKESAVISPCVPSYGDATPSTPVSAGQTH